MFTGIVEEVGIVKNIMRVGRVEKYEFAQIKY